MRSIEKWTEEPIANLEVASLDVTDDQSVETFVRRVVEVDGRIDILINNAGYGMAGTIEAVTIEEAKSVFDVNVWGVVRMLQAVLPHMRKQKTGHIINISSTSGIRGIPCMEIYTGSKFALEGISDSMRYSLAPFNISVTNLNAGPVRTAFTDRFGNAEKGGKGTRQIPNDETGYLKALINRLIKGLEQRIQSPEGQTGGDVAKLLVNIAGLKIKAKRLTDVPFNIGSSMDSQKILEEVKKQPTGWGGLYYEILQGLPRLKTAPPAPNTLKNEL